MIPPSLTECRRCGTCCDKGGPTFHVEDRMLVDSGLVPAKHLYTLRKGELVNDSIKGRLLPLESEMIKIKGQNRAWTCVYFDKAGSACGIYEHRPLECRILKCWDTRDIEAVYSQNRLTRKDLLSGIPALWSLIQDHDLRCSHVTLRKLLDAKSVGATAKKTVQEMVEYDRAIRILVVEKAGVESNMLDFIFGRPLSEAIR
ncbi:MAG: YkgJ family cysteine cluster protein [Deltaproteobacteria bacterium]|nr:YkgJ family cysteine cluster protein [Deltaproteobacteria bacterium]